MVSGERCKVLLLGCACVLCLRLGCACVPARGMINLGQHSQADRHVIMRGNLHKGKGGTGVVSGAGECCCYAAAMLLFTFTKDGE